MPEYRLSRSARLDLIEIADYTVDTWGLTQASRYLDGLDGCFRRLARTPGIGRPCDRIRRGYRRMEYEKHVIIYRADVDGIFISRILHQRMMPSRHLIEDA
ncbi:MAG: type II toxin-antitoxin system RelE/ParE family toxin [Terracidiphilus sp.]